MSEDPNPAAVPPVDSPRRASMRARRLWLDGAAVLATVFAADLLVLLVLGQVAPKSAGGWQAALLDAALLSLVVALPLYLLLRNIVRGATRDARRARGPRVAAPYRQGGLRAVLYGTLLVLGAASGWQVWQAGNAEAARQVDAELITLAGHQRMQSQRIGRLAVLAALAPRNATVHLAELRHSQAAMQRASCE